MIANLRSLGSGSIGTLACGASGGFKVSVKEAWIVEVSFLLSDGQMQRIEPFSRILMSFPGPMTAGPSWASITLSSMD